MTRSKGDWERGKLQTYAFWLAVTVVLSTGIVLLLLDGGMSTHTILSSIGLNLIASVIFALIFSWLSGTVQQRILLDTVREEQRGATERLGSQIAGVSSELFEKISGSETRYTPDATYGSGDDFDPAFNMAISQSVEDTVTYAFRGTSAKYLPVRLDVARNKPRQIKIMMLDPSSKRVLARRATDRSRHSTSEKKTIEQLIDQIRDEILMSLVALFDRRNFYDIEIAFVQETTVTRVELLDDHVYLSWYQGPSSPEARFPETLRFRRGTFQYDVHQQEFYRRLEITEQTFHPRADTSEDVLLAFLKQLTGNPVSVDELIRWRDEYHAFSEPIKTFLKKS